MRKNLHDRILKKKLKEQYLSLTYIYIFILLVKLFFLSQGVNLNTINNVHPPYLFIGGSPDTTLIRTQMHNNSGVVDLFSYGMQLRSFFKSSRKVP